MNTNRIRFSTLLGVVLVLTLTVGAPAQQGARDSARSGETWGALEEPPLKKDEVSAKELGAFADAALHVRMHRQALSNALANVQDPERAKAIQAQTYQAMVSSIEQKGLTIEEYNLLTQWTTEDEAMQERLEVIMEAKLEAQRQQAAERGQSRKAPAPSRGAKGGSSGYDR